MRNAHILCFAMMGHMTTFDDERHVINNFKYSKSVIEMQ